MIKLHSIGVWQLKGKSLERSAAAGCRNLVVIAIVLGAAGSWTVSPVLAGDLTVDNLTVLEKATGVLPTSGSRYVIVEQGADDAARGQKLRDAYTKAGTMSPSANSRVTVLVPPGEYNLGSSGITLDTPYVDVVGMVPARMTKRVVSAVVTDGVTDKFEKTVALSPVDCGLRLYGNGQGVIKQTVGHVRIANLIVANVRTDAGYVENPPDGAHDPANPASYWPDSGLDDVTVEHVYFDWSHAFSMRVCVQYTGIFRDCVGGHGSFGSNGGNEDWYGYAVASGSFEDCVGGNVSFGGRDVASGNFIYCSGGSRSFGMSASGNFDHCHADGSSFGGCVDCGASGSFRFCVAGGSSFGGEGSLSGTYDHCISGPNSFGASFHFEGVPEVDVAFVHCKAGAGSFGTLYKSSQDFNYNSKGFDLYIIPAQGDLSMGTFTSWHPAE